MPLPMRLRRRRLTVSCFVALLIGCSSEPATRKYGQRAERSPPGPSAPLQAAGINEAGGWTNDSLVPIEPEPDLDFGTMPGLEGDGAVIDPDGDDAVRIEQIEVCGFGNTGEKTVFLRVENSHKTAREGNCILGFVIVKIEAPLVTFEREGRLWKLAAGRKTDRKNNSHNPLIPASPPLFDPETAPETMALEADDPAYESAAPIDPILEELEIDIEDPADPMESNVEFQLRPSA